MRSTLARRLPALGLTLLLAAAACAKAASSADAGVADAAAPPDAKNVDPPPDAGPMCGNHVVEGPDESCDDGNTVTEVCAYGLEGCTVCDDACHAVAGAASRCGDTVTDAVHGETCDDGNAVTEVCPYGMASCIVCDDACHLVAGAVSQCGDGHTDAPAETCDDGNNTTEVCPYGVASCTVCNGACKLAPGETSLCGDNVIDAPDETCDDGNAVTDACPYGQTSCSVCTSTCHPGPGVTSFCGDGTIDAAHGEDCEDLNSTPGDGCTPACASESFESEPNDDGATATGGLGIVGNDFSSAGADGPFSVATRSYHLVAALFPAGDEDVFAVSAPGAARTMTFETFGPTTYGDCSGIDTGLTIRDAAGNALASDDDGGIGLCSRLSFTIAAGQTVFVHVVEFGDNNAITRYYLTITP